MMRSAGVLVRRVAAGVGLGLVVLGCSSTTTTTVVPDGAEAAIGLEAFTPTPTPSPLPTQVALPSSGPTPSLLPVVTPAPTSSPTPVPPTATPTTVPPTATVPPPTMTPTTVATVVTPVTATAVAAEPTVTATLTPTALADASVSAASELVTSIDPTPTLTPVPTITPPPTPDPNAPTATAGPSPTPIPRIVLEQAPASFSSINGVTIMLPARRVERIGYHQAGHTGSQQMETILSGVEFFEMDTRYRGTGARTAADLVVDPASPILAPVSGRVIAATTYTLYCEYVDDLVFIEPDGLPGFEMKIFHMYGLQVGLGDIVVAGQTVIASGARQLPFASQVDEFTAEPSWPHVHIEVVDPSIPDERLSGAGCP